MNIDIKALRLEIKATQLQFAKMLGISRAALVEWEAGTLKPSEKRLDVLNFLYSNKGRINCTRRKLIKNKREIPLEVIQQWLKDSDWRVRVAAMNACQGREIPLEVIQQGLKDSDCDVRVAAMNALKRMGLPIPSIRAFDPPSKVYKKCIGNVIIEAEIPLHAHVTGTKGQKCRSNEAIIVGIKGNLHGFSIGISLHDKKTTYFVGDTIQIDNYCFSNEECAEGFHFFNTLEEARNYSS